MRFLIGLHVLTIVIATSYLTLGVAAPSKARSVWWAYAIITLALAVTNLVLERREAHHGRS